MLAEHCARVSCAHRKDMHAGNNGYCSICNCSGFQVVSMMHDNDEIVTSSTGGKQSKLEYAFELIEPDFLLRMAHVLYTGKLKYGAKNWQLLTDPNEHIGRAMYHLTQALKGTDHSEDHLANAACRIMFAQWAQRADRTIPTNFLDDYKDILDDYKDVLPQHVPIEKWCQQCEHDKDAHLITPNIEGDVLVCAKCGCRRQVIKDEDSWCSVCKHRMSSHTIAIVGSFEYWACNLCGCDCPKFEPSIDPIVDQDTESHSHPYDPAQSTAYPPEAE